MRQYNIKIVIKKLTGSDLGWFSECRKKGISKGNQRGVNLDLNLMKQIFPPDLISQGSFIVHTSYKAPNDMIIRDEPRPIRHQAKNWRLTGEKIEGEVYGKLKPEDYLVMVIYHDDDKWRVVWDVAYDDSKNDDRKELYAFLNKRVVHNEVWKEGSVNFKTGLSLIRKLLPDFLPITGIDDTSKIRVARALSNTHILAQVLGTVASLSSKVQLDYIETLEILVDSLRHFLKNDIYKIDLDHKGTWQGVKGKKIGFIDGGVASISSLGSEPIAVRVGTYTVIPGEEGDNREAFNFRPQLVDELFDPGGDDSLFEDFSDNIPKLRDMARITMEAGGVYKSLFEERDFAYLFLHGPLVNPVAPYADYPAFTNKALDVLGINENNILNDVKSIPTDGEGRLRFRHFIAVYLYLLKKICQSGVPIAGIIERSAGSSIVVRTILKHRESQGYTEEAREFSERMREYRISDSILFACLLQEGEYIRPMEIDKNTLQKSPEEWKAIINKYPRPLTTYLKPTETSLPFRIEISPGEHNIPELMQLIYHMARLLPKYAFPVGLDIADKFAKVPSWMSKQMSREQAAHLLRRAIDSGKPEVIDLVRLYLTGNARDWLFRPKFDK